jgi:lipoprotein-anchoring transpeptidase ErfK/SrfK
VAEAVGPSLEIFAAPGAGAAGRALANPQSSGSPLVLLVVARQGAWLKALLPVRPNGSTGWVRAGDVTLSEHDFSIVVELGAHRITAFRGTEPFLSEPVAVGAGDTPTPTGLFYTKELLRPPSDSGPYGPWAFGLSGFSNVLWEFAGGDGTIGLHGTNAPSLLGQDVSHGCIRMSNAGITALARTLPPGVPVDIRP